MPEFLGLGQLRSPVDEFFQSIKLLAKRYFFEQKIGRGITQRDELTVFNLQSNQKAVQAGNQRMMGCFVDKSTKPEAQFIEFVAQEL